MAWRPLTYIVKLLIAITPLWLVPYLLGMESTHPRLARFLGTEEKHVQIVAVGLLSTVDILLLAAYETVAHFLPQRQAKRIADVYVDSLFKQFETQAETIGIKLGTDVRVNVMFTRRSALTLFFRRFVWFANKGFDGSHKDNGLFLLVRQGLCGQAFCQAKTLSVDLRAQVATGWRPCADNYWLLPCQRKRTAPLTAILTIPIFAEYKSGPMTRHKTVGVINIDAVSDLGAERVLANKAQLDAFFKESGKILALFAVT